VQSPHPPVWGAAVRSRQSFAWLGEQGFNLLVTPAFSPLSNLQDLISIYRESFHSAHPAVPTGATVAVSLPLYIAETDDVAYREGDRHLQHYFDVWADAASGWDRVHSRDYVGYTGMARAIRDAKPDAMRTNGNAIIGCPERVLDEVYRLSEALDVDLVLWQLDFGAMPLDRSRRTLTSFVEWIMPRLCGAALTSEPTQADGTTRQASSPAVGSITQPASGLRPQRITGMAAY
jgi:alkanesulfonate monooxygenase SsuD/methylene tetrahydromethanopterin reductase-like flavin-dependent oxidoreductase (luciferase family)